MTDLSPRTVIEMDAPRVVSNTLAPAVSTAQPSSSSWVSSWFSGGGKSAAPAVTEKAALKQPPIFHQESEIPPQKAIPKTRSVSTDDFSGKNPAVVLPLKERPTRHESVSGASRDIPGGKISTSKPDEPRRKSKAAPPIPLRTGTMQSNFSYDTLKERADDWKKERSKRPSRVVDRQDSFMEQMPDPSARYPEFMEDTSRPKIRFTPEESDKVDKDILRLMGALEDNRYPFNRDKNMLFNKLRLIRWKQMGLLFAHRELDGTGYFDTDREEFGCDVIADQFGTMYSVIDAISRDVYELRELLYYERKNQTPPTRRGSADRRTSSEPPPAVHNLKSASFPARSIIPPLSTHESDDGILSTVPTMQTPSSPRQASSPTRPILKHSLSTESFKSAKSDDTIED